MEAALIEIALKSEVLGEAFFRSAYYTAFLANRRNSAKALWQLENQTKKRILEYFAVNNGVELMSWGL